MNNRTRKKVRARNRHWKEVWEQSRLTREIEGAFEPDLGKTPWLIDPTIGKPVLPNHRVSCISLDKNSRTGSKDEVLKWVDKDKKPIFHKPQASTTQPEKALEKPLPWNFGGHEEWLAYCAKEKEKEEKAKALADKKKAEEDERNALLSRGVFIPRVKVVEATGITRRTPPEPKPVKPTIIKVNVVHSRDYVPEGMTPAPKTTRDKLFLEKGRYTGHNGQTREKFVQKFFSPVALMEV